MGHPVNIAGGYVEDDETYFIYLLYTRILPSTIPSCEVLISNPYHNLTTVETIEADTEEEEVHKEIITGKKSDFTSRNE
jgi:hypothetical protein